jgi:hypothetical protein
LNYLINLARSPVYAHATNTSAGIITIRASESQDEWIKKFFYYSDEHTKTYFVFKTLWKWLAVRLNFILTAFIFVFVFLCILTKGKYAYNFFKGDFLFIFQRYLRAKFSPLKKIPLRQNLRLERIHPMVW